MNNNATICDKKNCTGCGICFISCPKKAIEMINNSHGFYYPFIDMQKCISCNICRGVCQSNHIISFKSPFACYAAESKIRKSRNSTSGGIASLAAEVWIKNGGVVYASTYDSVLNIFCFKRFDYRNLDDFFEYASGSKYIQTNIWECVKGIENDLANNVKVLTIGTPCQISGLELFFKENKNLYLVDLLCHGVPSQKMLFDNLTFLRSSSSIKNILFRENKKYRLKVFNDFRVAIYNKSPFDNCFLEGFQSNLILRESCFNCNYSTINRVGDISLGDFWGLPYDTSRNIQNPSIILVNTEKGQQLFTLIKDDIFFSKEKCSDAQRGNECLRKPATPHKNRESFLRLYENNSFDYCVKRTRTFKKRLQHMPLLNMIVRKKYGYYK